MAMSLTIFSTSRRLAGKTDINKDNNKDGNNIVNNKHEREEENKNVSNQDKQTIPNTSTNTHAQANIYRTLSHHQTMRSFPEAGYSGEGIPDGLFRFPQTHRHQQLIWEQTSTKSTHLFPLSNTHTHTHRHYCSRTHPKNLTTLETILYCKSKEAQWERGRDEENFVTEQEMERDSLLN